MRSSRYTRPYNSNPNPNPNPHPHPNPNPNPNPNPHPSLNPNPNPNPKQVYSPFEVFKLFSQEPPSSFSLPITHLV